MHRSSNWWIMTAALVLTVAGCGPDDDAGYDGNNGSAMESGEAANNGASESSDNPVDDSAADDSGSEGELDPEAGQLTAGEWSDLEHWSFWLELFGVDSEANFEQYESLWDMHTRTRFAIAVQTPGGAPVIDTPVVLQDSQGDAMWSARTDNLGHAELYQRAFDQENGSAAEVVVGAEPDTATLDAGELTTGQREVVELDVDPQAADTLDLMLVVDTTGSMSDELDYLQSELGNVVAQTNQHDAGSLSIRLSVNVYRDHGESYVVRDFAFTRNTEQAVADLDAQVASGGGDYPEAVREALENAVSDHEWSEDARARLLFLVLDAPPHEASAVIDSLHQTLQEAARKGIRIIPVASSGVDKKTEFFLRASAIFTGGTYIFLTDDSGIGNSHIEPTIGDYDVEYLNKLLVRVIADYTR